MELNIEDVRAKWTPGRLLIRDLFFISGMASPIMIMAVYLLLRSRLGTSDGLYSSGFSVLDLILICVIGSVFASAILISWRYTLYSRILSRGSLVTATMLSQVNMGAKVYFGPIGFGSNYSTTFSYSVNGERISSMKSVGPHLMVGRLPFEPGKAAQLMVDPKKPDRFIIIDRLR